MRLLYLGGCNGFDWDVAPGLVKVFLYPCPFEPSPPHRVTYDVPLGPLAPGTYAVRLYDDTGADPFPALATGSLRVRASGRCLPADDRLCLHDGRFALTGEWRAFDGRTGIAHAVPLDGNEQSGLLWFFGRDNAEVTAKVLDGCGVNGHWWVFLSSASTVEYTVTVTDTTSGHVQTYRNELGETPTLSADTAAFEECP